MAGMGGLMTFVRLYHRKPWSELRMSKGLEFFVSIKGILQTKVPTFAPIRSSSGDLCVFSFMLA